MTKNDGGAAFPQAQSDYIDHPTYGYIHRAQAGQEIHPGMSLRDWFAGQADISGIDVSDVRDLAQALGIDASDQSPIGQLRYGAAVAAAMRYIFADAMLAERAKATARLSEER